MNSNIINYWHSRIEYTTNQLWPRDFKPHVPFHPNKHPDDLYGFMYMLLSSSPSRSRKLWSQTLKEKVGKRFFSAGINHITHKKHHNSCHLNPLIGNKRYATKKGGKSEFGFASEFRIKILDLIAMKSLNSLPSSTMNSLPLSIDLLKWIFFDPTDLEIPNFWG